MQIQATLKKYGDPNIRKVAVKLPEDAAKLLEPFSVEILECDWTSCITALSAEDDFAAVVFNPRMANAYRVAFRELVERVKNRTEVKKSVGGAKKDLNQEPYE